MATLLALALGLLIGAADSGQGRRCGAGIADAESFVDGLYGRYAGGGRPVEGRHWPYAPAIWRDECIFTAPLMARTRRFRESGMGRGGPDHVVDPVCQCAEWGDLRVAERVVTLSGAGRAEARVRFRDGGSDREVRLQLEQVEGGWRIADLSSADLPRGLIAYYEAAAAEQSRLFADPDRFVEALYARYRDPMPVAEFARRNAAPIWVDSNIFTSELLYRAQNYRLGPGAGDPPDFVVDPICQCARWQYLMPVERSLVLTGPDAATAEVRFRNGAIEKIVRLQLQRTAAGWRVSNVFSAELPQGLAEYYRVELDRRLARRQPPGA